MASAPEQALLPMTSAPNEQAECFLGEKLGKEMVAIFVGPKRKEFIIHKELICESEFFKGAFMSSFAEAQEGIMYLPDDNPAAFDLYVEWAYRKRIPNGHTETYLYSLFDLYIMADKFCNTVLKDKVMDTIQDIAKKHNLLDPIFPKELVLKVFESSSDDNGGLALFVIHLMCYAFLSRMEGKGCGGSKTQSNKTFKDDDLDLMWDLGKESKTIFKLFQERVLKTVRGPSNKTTVDPRDRDESRTQSLCQFHSHQEGFYCRGEDDCTQSGFILDVSRKSCLTVKKVVLNLISTPGDKLYTLARVASRSDKFKVNHGKSSWTLVLSKQDRLLQVYNEFNEHVLEIPIGGIDRIVACELGASPQMIIHRSRYSDPFRPAICMEFKTTEQCNTFSEDLRAACKTSFSLKPTSYVEKAFQGILLGSI
ncbi:hypothetical protein ONS95_008185 [Cadophora gregata]|uniref:uncharacterized protein n=1 Tax=Cadophora gregata TaxID=51156 RepID=UPI0026DD751C|nr:uncharacterized protein ONS95_008185 [Cadophora gregata]KAK0100220.1 hypothetical protein ONS96_007505 [Cadophora gregata f. sp. sojae]KAK0106769.1 hypothetical protein ONS96_004387 [Cadophora gregata f. sp. sojae]KAK0119343.1 hypothetical protein ONS96_012396 [Cadophora gregata f. sp. sojae]KAK0126597.1 hypothetical protein ONS95_008185 [Cadophora gregata]